MTKQAPGPRYAGQGHAMQIEGTVAILIAVVVIGVALAVFGPQEPNGIVMLALGAVSGIAGVVRLCRGTTFRSIEERVGPSLFGPDSD
ncbi:hypothetical protein CPI83_28815 (plasmid) [Rhodococcus sp. H-CA8f]|nr:hypothetical protein CPI83_28815 [Rhodococcus sp. H-CA8f]